MRSYHLLRLYLKLYLFHYKFNFIRDCLLQSGLLSRLLLLLLLLLSPTHGDQPLGSQLSLLPVLKRLQKIEEKKKKSLILYATKHHL